MDTIGNTPELSSKQAQYVEWLALPAQHRDPATQTELAEKLEVNRSTLWRWRKDPRLKINERASALAKDQLVEHLPSVYAALAHAAIHGTHNDRKLFLQVVDEYREEQHITVESGSLRSKIQDRLKDLINEEDGEEENRRPLR